MPKSLPWLPIVLVALLLLAPGPAGRFLLDLLGGLTLTILILPFILVGAGLIAWQIFKRLA